MTVSTSQNEIPDPEEIAGKRVDAPLPRLLVRICSVGISVVALTYILDLTYLFDITFFQEQYFGLLYGLVFAAGFISLPPLKRLKDAPVGIYDYVLAVIGLLAGAYLFFAWPTLVVQAGVLTPVRVAVSAVGLLLILELTRRAFGWPMVILALLFIAYALFNFLLPGSFGGRGTPWRRLVAFVYTDTNSILGIISSVVFGMVFAFMLFGRALFLAGGGGFFTDFSMALMGNRRGGSAKVAVIASSLFGTLSGSASSNVVVTGSITIPMMVRSGYRPASAAAVEAVASAGGGLMPPIMGATAFIMAEFLAVPYRDVVLAALLPAVLYFLTVFVQVDIEAGRLGLRGLDRSELPRLMAVIKNGWPFIIPLGVLIYCLFFIFLSPSKSALIAFAVVVGVGLMRPKIFGLRQIYDSIENTGQLMIGMGILAAIAGVIVGIINLTGLGLLFSQELLSLAGGALFLLLVLTGIASIILGMSMPVTASYVILAVLAAPAIENAGVPPIAAHLFIFYFANLSFITPPVCVAIFVAATIAGSKPMETAVEAMKLAVVAFIVPFVFVYDQAILMEGTWFEIVVELLTCVVGFIALSVALQGFFSAAVGNLLRLGLAAAGIAAIIPVIGIKLAGVAAAAALLALVYALGRRAADVSAAGQD
tara:strand:+ start:10967 stop:12916 length:1950 start_codon:yes stop_codon:yes gene_type:complete